MYFQLCVESARENIIWEDLPNYLIILLRRRECDLEYISKYHVIGMYTVFASFSRPGEFARPRPSLLSTSRLIKRVPPPRIPVQIDGSEQLRATSYERRRVRRYSPHVTGHDAGR